MKNQVTWILVADGSRAKVFLAAGNGKIEQQSNASIAHPPSRGLVSDRPGRTFDSVGQGRHAKEPPSDPHDRAETDFLLALAQQLDAAHDKKEFDRLVVIAPPRALGILRSAFPKRLANAVSQELAHDLAGFEEPALETYLATHEII